MVIQTGRKRELATMAVECAVALGILATVMIPLSLSFIQETRLARAYYHKAVALELIDGEMEVLVAGEWRAWEQGEHPYPITVGAVRNLPPGRFLLNLSGDRVRLDWVPASRNQGGKVSREVKLK